MADENVDPHTRIILDRYADRQNISVGSMGPAALYEKYLSKAMRLDELTDRTILELGAGCSQYVGLFLDAGCKTYYANDLIPERLKVLGVVDSRYVELPGDFRAVYTPEPVDIVFASLTMMFIMPMLDDFIVKIRDSLKPGGVFLSYDPNYMCPLSVYRRFADRKANPARLFSPFAYAKRFESHAFEVERLTPLTAEYPWTVGSWAFGTSFWLRARKK
jgi:SAM-dependent methyltransferase